MLSWSAVLGLVCLFCASKTSFCASDPVIVRVCYNATTKDFLVNGDCTQNPVAYAEFRNEINITGWSFLQLETSNNFDNDVQAYAAGIAEAVATKELIWQNWQNTVSDLCNGTAAFCQRLRTFLDTNLDWMKTMIHRHAGDPYWEQVKLPLLQLSGLEDGFFGTVVAPHLNIEPFRFLLLQVGFDIGDLSGALGGPNSLKQMHCSAFVKPINKYGDLVFSHVSWSGYKTMLRIQKLYKLGYQIGGQPIPGSSMTLSSYPGTLWSGDDFYLISSGLAVMETTIENSNATLYKLYVKPKGTLLTWIRVLLGNRLATKTTEWASFMKKFNSGTYNNQWMVIDYKKFAPGQPLNPGLFHVLELMPGYTHDEDMTSFLDKQGYWPSYNVPYFKDIFDISGGAEQQARMGDWFSYDKTPRALIFKRDWKNVKDMPTLQRLMRYNDFRNDPLSRCNCTPPYSAENAISARCDLNPANGTYPFGALGHRAHGGIDMKATNFELVKKLQFLSISGPTHDNLEPFVWSKSDYGKTQPHLGQPDEWKFEPVTYEWELL